MMIRAAKRGGFTLVEMHCVIVALAVLIGFLTVLLVETMEVQRLQAEGFDKLLHNNALADQFRADVAQAEDAPLRWKRFNGDLRTLILHMKNEGHVVYRWQEAKLVRHTFEDGKEFESSFPVGGDRVGVEFVRVGAKPTIVSLRLVALRDGTVLPGQALEIAAALGGDWR
jgi:prepilin-type N-terminal cleavage/methylation domain-containing protein